MGAGKVVLVDGEAVAPLAPNGRGATTIYSSGGTVSSDGRRSSSGLNSIVLSQGGCLSGLERLQMQLAIGCLRMLSTMGHQGPAEGSVLGEEVEDDARRMDHQLAASRQSGYRGAAHSPEKMRPAQEKAAPSRPRVHAYDAMPAAASDMDDAWLDDRMAVVPMARSAADSSAVAQQFCGAWHNEETLNIDEYLKHIGVSWPKRTVRRGSAAPVSTRSRVGLVRDARVPVAGAGRGCMRAVLTPQPCAAFALRCRSRSPSSPSRAGRSSTALCR